MKNRKRIFSSLLMALVLVMALAPAAMAADVTATIDITGKKDTFTFSPGSEYSSTDLFPNFKNLMPGDTVTQRIEITHRDAGLGKFKLYVRMIPHSTANPPQRGVPEASVAEMNEFLSQLDLKIYRGPVKDTVTPFYSGSPDKAHQLSDYVLLGEFNKGARGLITVQLTVPLDMGNEFADRAGEFDLEFMLEEIPPAIIPQTGDATNIGLLITVAGLSLAAIVVVVVILLRKKKQ